MGSGGAEDCANLGLEGLAHLLGFGRHAAGLSKSFKKLPIEGSTGVWESWLWHERVGRKALCSLVKLKMCL